MTATTLANEDYKSLVNKLSSSRDELDVLVTAISISASVVDIIIRCIYQVYIIRGFLKTLNKIIESKCIDCDSECDITIKEYLESVSENMKITKQMMEEHWIFPAFVINMKGRTIEQLDDIIEDYWISSDKETKELVSSISSKIKQMHAIH
jgi:hypothetical protein